MKKEECKTQFIQAFQTNVTRRGADRLLDWLQSTDFFDAPASTRFHAAYAGGLAEHSLNVLEYADKLASKWLPAEKYKELYPSIVICSLLHDLGKCGDFRKPNYVPNVLKNGKVSEAKPYETNKELLNVPHEVRSVKLCALFVDLTEDEEYAILMHNGLYGPFKYGLQGNETPLYMIIHFADMWASRVVEKEEK